MFAVGVVLLVLSPSAARSPVAELPLRLTGDWEIPRGDKCIAEDGRAVEFKQCCDFRFVLRHVWRMIGQKGELEVAHAGCLDRTYWQCCQVNDNHDEGGLPWYNKGVLYIRVRSRRSGRNYHIKLLQGSALNWWGETLAEHAGKPKLSRSFPRFDISINTGAGLLWPSGYALAQVLAELSEEENLNEAMTFLDVGAGTGLASMVALLRGWRVLSTDLLAESHRQRVLSATATFGNGTAGRFRTGELDIFNPDTWPAATFQVIGATLFRSFEDLHHLAFRRLVSKCLAPRGVALYTFNFPEYLTQEVKEMMPRFLGLGEDKLEGSLLRQEGPRWVPIEDLDEIRSALYLVAFRHATA
ncbi:unnamed protein product [Durusdinium trenchii]|uniref:Methyltransferase domain-containing protein n=1 Tax=Durusdinium trenchii TaxID=1381693 RepID=A0ABP0SVP7_9DINO